MIRPQLIYKLESLDLTGIASYQMLRTVNGIASDSRGTFRPKRFVMHPKNIFPTKPPTHRRLTIQDSSSTVIAPLCNGVSFDSSMENAADGQPQTAP